MRHYYDLMSFETKDDFDDPFVEDHTCCSPPTSCPRCGIPSDRLLGVTGRGAWTVYVCPDCRSDAMTSDRSFWHWYWKEA